MTRIAYLPGDGIGPEVLAVARRVLDAAGFEAEWVEGRVGWECWRNEGDALPQETIRVVRSCDATLFGAITSKPEAEAQAELAPQLRGKGLTYRSPILRLRRELGLWANIRPVRRLTPTNGHRIDLVVFRENTEDLYSGLEARPFTADLRSAWARIVPRELLPALGDETAITTRVVTRAATERIARAAFEHAVAEGRAKVTLVEKPNIMRATGGLVREVFWSVAKEFPTVRADELNADAALARLVHHADTFDVVVATNFIGDLVSEVAAEVAGGMPLAASCNRGDDHALFEPVHGSAPDIAGKGVANPLGAVLAGAGLAEYVGQAEVGARMRAAVDRLLGDADALPRDLGGRSTTKQVAVRLTSTVSSLAVRPSEAV